jgi:hypothetical protein
MLVYSTRKCMDSLLLCVLYKVIIGFICVKEDKKVTKNALSDTTAKGCVILHSDKLVI